MIWTVLDETMLINQNTEITAPREYIYRNRLILGYPLDQGRVRISSLISSDPQDYLNPRFAPDTVIRI